MPRITAYHRPQTLTEAITLLADPARTIVAGATSIRHEETGEPAELVDVQALGLDEISPGDDRLRIGATSTLQQLVDDDRVPGLLRDAALAEEPSTLRTLATVGGAVAGRSSDSMLLTTLLVLDAEVAFADDSTRPLADVLRVGLEAQELVVAVEVETGGDTAQAATRRTRRDTPIVGVAGRKTAGGTIVAMCGVAPTPIVVDPTRLSDLNPPADFRGSSEYRSALARMLLDRVREQLS